jgi:hypothetical protein
MIPHKWMRGSQSPDYIAYSRHLSFEKAAAGKQGGWELMTDRSVLQHILTCQWLRSWSWETMPCATQRESTNCRVPKDYRNRFSEEWSQSISVTFQTLENVSLPFPASRFHVFQRITVMEISLTHAQHFFCLQTSYQTVALHKNDFISDWQFRNHTKLFEC